ncbi:Bacterial membrane protein YfhO [Gemmata obscuriglobus]|nr:Bacterial membrane protein YfhO [Gemmata obscuriglobus]VTS06309.1 Putative uncharacterized protein OS=Candidatus Kuenenia stuttgartiensis GN=kustc0433 PE=4 SV=1: YfhO [Gemmata obscuriglobus UQM 2246]
MTPKPESNLPSGPLPDGKGRSTAPPRELDSRGDSDAPLLPSKRGVGGGSYFFRFVRPYLVLALLWALYFHPLILHPTQTIYAPYSDLLAEHLPVKLFLNREWRASGELPLWNPYHFCGTPLVHDPQVGTFYPPNFVVLAVPEHAVGAAVSWGVALHVLAAGALALVYARARGLNEPASLVAAIGFMLSSKWMTHLLLAGHTITAGLTWLPLLLLLIERAIDRRGTRAVVWAGVPLALLGLGTHPQWAFYATVFAFVWTYRRDARGRWLGCWFGAAVVAAALMAVQLLPALESAQYSARSDGVDASGALGIGLQTAVRLIGPALSYSPPQAWEMQGVFGAFWLVAAVAAPVVGGPRTRWQFGVFCALVLFALGGAALIDWLPGFNLFRVPTRMLLIATFPLAFLAGVTTQALTESRWALSARAAVSRGFRRVVLVLVAPTILGLWFNDGPVWWAFVAYWGAAVLALPLFIRTLQNTGTSGRLRTALWFVILLAELIAPIAVLPQTKPQAELYPSSPVLDYLREQPQPVRVLDWDVHSEGTQTSLLGTGAPQAMVQALGTPRGYNPLDVRHYREFLAFAVGDDRPVRGNSPYAQQVMPNFEVGEPHVFALLRVTHHVAPVGTPPPPGDWRVCARDPAPPAVVPLLPGTPPTLPPHTLREFTPPKPRAWIVPHGERLEGAPFAALKTCDFDRTVLITTRAPLPPMAGTKPGAARVTHYGPNRVTTELDGSAGWLVLSDVWFPGWTCFVDGREVEVSRANHAFRAVPVPAGSAVAEFRFEPRTYRLGWWVSVVAAVLMLGLGVWSARRG